MARMVKEAAFAAKRSAILGTAQRAVETTGYEQMTLTELLSELHISSWAFYRCFGSKSALLLIIHNPKLSALDKLQRFIATLDHEKRSGWSRPLRKSGTAAGIQFFTELIEKVKESN